MAAATALLPLRGSLGRKPLSGCHLRGLCASSLPASAGWSARGGLGGGVSERRFGYSVAAAAWQEVKDAATGKPYWWNADTGETSWSCPPPEAAPETPAASTRGGPGDTEGPTCSNEELLKIFSDYVESPDSRFDYPAPTQALTELVESHRDAIYSEAGFFDFLNEKIFALEREAKAGGYWGESARLGSTAAGDGPTAQAGAAGGNAMFDEGNFMWNADASHQSEQERLESIRARLANPDVKGGGFSSFL